MTKTTKMMFLLKLSKPFQWAFDLICRAAYKLHIIAFYDRWRYPGLEPIFDWDVEKPLDVIFIKMGHNVYQVCILERWKPGVKEL